MKKLFTLLTILLFASTVTCQNTIFDGVDLSGIRVGPTPCTIQMISASDGGVYEDSNDNGRKLMGCDIYRLPDGWEQKYSGSVIYWWWDGSAMTETGFLDSDAWRYTDNESESLICLPLNEPCYSRGDNEQYLYKNADYVLYSVGANDVAILGGCTSADEGYDNTTQVANDSINFIDTKLIGELGYREDQIIIFFPAPVPFTTGGTFTEDVSDNMTGCRASGLTDGECITIADNQPEGVNHGWRCTHTNQNLQNYIRAVQASTIDRNFIVVSYWDWVVDSYVPPDNSTGYIDQPLLDFWERFGYNVDGIHPSTYEANNYLWWYNAVELIEATIRSE